MRIQCCEETGRMGKGIFTFLTTYIVLMIKERGR
jgi:hypothetical protein